VDSGDQSGDPGTPHLWTTDRERADAAKRRDPDAWEELYRAVYPRLRAYVDRRVGRQQGEDMVNETMTRAVAGIDRFEWGAAGFDGWLFGIARRVTADHLRKSGRGARAYARMPADLDPQEPGDAIEVDEDAARIRKAFAQLSAPEREVLELRVVAGLTAEQAAVALGKRAGAVRMAQSRALAELRRRMGEP
jgi:RNA polymerase sigma-70 factor (ECF subfamily)